MAAATTAVVVTKNDEKHDDDIIIPPPSRDKEELWSVSQFWTCKNCTCSQNYYNENRCSTCQQEKPRLDSSEDKPAFDEWMIFSKEGLDVMRLMNGGQDPKETDDYLVFFHDWHNYLEYRGSFVTTRMSRESRLCECFRFPKEGLRKIAWDIEKDYIRGQFPRFVQNISEYYKIWLHTVFSTYFQQYEWFREKDYNTRDRRMTPSSYTLIYNFKSRYKSMQNDSLSTFFSTYRKCRTMHASTETFKIPWLPWIKQAWTLLNESLTTLPREIVSFLITYLSLTDYGAQYIKTHSKSRSNSVHFSYQTLVYDPVIDVWCYVSELFNPECQYLIDPKSETVHVVTAARDEKFVHIPNLLNRFYVCQNTNLKYTSTKPHTNGLVCYEIRSNTCLSPRYVCWGQEDVWTFIPFNFLNHGRCLVRKCLFDLNSLKFQVSYSDSPEVIRSVILFYPNQSKDIKMVYMGYDRYFIFNNGSKRSILTAKFDSNEQLVCVDESDIQFSMQHVDECKFYAITPQHYRVCCTYTSERAKSKTKQISIFTLLLEPETQCTRSRWNLSLLFDHLEDQVLMFDSRNYIRLNELSKNLSFINENIILFRHFTPNYHQLAYLDLQQTDKGFQSLAFDT